MRVIPAVRLAMALVCGAALLVAPMSVGAWGMDVHRWLTRQALDGLPGELKPFFAEQRDFIGEHSVDPDLWRVADLRSSYGGEDPNHFLDIDALDDPAPFRNVPRTWAGLVEKYGVARAEKAGRLPWRAEDMYNKLVSMFQELAKPNGSGYAADNARYLAAVFSHYIEDAHQPFHATENYDGQLTNQRGIHSRFETELVLRHRESLNVVPTTLRPIGNIRDFMFETVIASQALVAPVLQADRAAAAGRESYDDAYYAALFASVRPLLQKRLAETTTSLASVIVAAWEQGGKPALPLKTLRPPARIRR